MYKIELPVISRQSTRHFCMVLLIFGALRLPYPDRFALKFTKHPKFCPWVFCESLLESRIE